MPVGVLQILNIRSVTNKLSIKSFITTSRVLFFKATKVGLAHCDTENSCRPDTMISHSEFHNRSDGLDKKKALCQPK